MGNSETNVSNGMRPRALILEHSRQIPECSYKNNGDSDSVAQGFRRHNVHHLGGYVPINIYVKSMTLIVNNETPDIIDKVLN